VATTISMSRASGIMDRTVG